jgi:hypothetical protein
VKSAFLRLLSRAVAISWLPWLLAAAFPLAGLLLVMLAPDYGGVYLDYGRSRLGSYLLAGLPVAEVARNMPLFGILFSLVLNLGAGPAAVYLPLQFAVCLLAWRVGRLLGGAAAGLISLCAAGVSGLYLVFSYDVEQTFYSWFLLLALGLLWRLRREPGPAAAAACGFALGVSMLVRTPLFVFPAALAALDFLRSRGAPGPALRRAALLGAAFLLPLLPWGWLNLRVNGEFVVMDVRRADDNVITAALGTVYSMHGNSYRLAGIRIGESSLRFYAREIARDPAFHALAVLRRLLGIFLYFPSMFLLLGLVFLLNREKGRAWAFSLPAYLVLIHALLSIGNRYFHPVFYLLAPLLGWTLAARLGLAGEAEPEERISFRPHLAFALCGALLAGAVAAAYPARAAAPEPERRYLAAVEKYRRDWAFWRARCRLRWQEGDDAGYRACLAGYAAVYDDKAARYFLEVTAAADPAAVPLPKGSPEMPPQVRLEGYLLRAFRQAELGDAAGAADSLRLANEVYDRDVNAMISLAPYKRDLEVARLISEDRESFWRDFAAERLMMWPPAGIAAALKVFFAAGLDERGLLRAQVAARLAHGKLNGRRLTPREEGLLPAWAVPPPPEAPEAAASPLQLCRAESAAGRLQSALAACQTAAYAGAGPGYEAYDAALESALLLRRLGRAEEAETAISWLLLEAPAGWPGRARAEKLARGGDR